MDLCQISFSQTWRNLAVGWRERFLDSLIDGQFGDGIVISWRKFKLYFSDDPETYPGVFLSNSEMETGRHSPTYEHFPMRNYDGDTEFIRQLF